MLMLNVFLFCAVVGGSLLVIQTALTACGLADSDTECAQDAALDFDADCDAEIDADLDAVGGVEAGEIDSVDSDSDNENQGSNWLFSVLSFRTLVAATSFFGLSGTASMQFGLSQALALCIAVSVGFAAMLTVHYLMRTLYSTQPRWHGAHR